MFYATIQPIVLVAFYNAIIRVLNFRRLNISYGYSGLGFKLKGAMAGK